MVSRRSVARALARTKLGERTLWSIARSDPQLLIEALGPQLNRAPRLGTVERWPRSLNGFEDLVFLFASTSLNHGIIALAFDEAAYIYRLVRGLGAATIAEIGRYKGGSTVLIAAAIDRGATLWSYDLHVKLMMTQLGPQIDAEVQRTLERYGLHERGQACRCGLESWSSLRSEAAISSSSTVTIRTRECVETTKTGGAHCGQAGTSFSTMPRRFVRSPIGTSMSPLDERDSRSGQRVLRVCRRHGRAPSFRAYQRHGALGRGSSRHLDRRRFRPSAP